MPYDSISFRWRTVVNLTNQQPSNWCHSWNMSRPCFRQQVPVKENFLKPPRLRYSKPQGKVIASNLLCTIDFPLTPTPRLCLGLRVCLVSTYLKMCDKKLSDDLGMKALVRYFSYGWRSGEWGAFLLSPKYKLAKYVFEGLNLTKSMKCLPTK